MTSLGLLIPLALVGGALAIGAPQSLHIQESGAGNGYEVWVIDQSDTTAEGGGTLYIYDGDAVTGDDPTGAAEVVDLGGDAGRFCLEQTGSVPKRPHMFEFNAANTHAVLAYVATGHVLFMDAATRAPLACLDVGEQAHAAFPSPDERYVVVANQNGKLLQRITTDYTTNTFTLDEAATLNLASCTTPSGTPCEEPTLRPDVAPICPAIDASSRFTAVTLRGGGLFVVDSTATPLAIVAEYDAATVNQNGCGGVETADGTLYLNAGGGTPHHPFGSSLYAFQVGEFTTTTAAPNTPSPALVFSIEEGERADSHGAALTGDGAYLWVADRAANVIVVVDTATNQVVNEIALAGTVSDDPAPDLIGLSPDGALMFASLRGPAPLTGNAPDHHNAVGATPGLGIVRVAEDGRSGELVAVLPISNLVDGAETADPHGMRVRPT